MSQARVGVEVAVIAVPPAQREGGIPRSRASDYQVMEVHFSLSRIDGEPWGSYPDTR